MAEPLDPKETVAKENKMEEQYSKRLTNEKTQEFLISKYHKAFDLHEWLLQSCMKCMDEGNVQLNDLMKNIVYMLFIKGFRTYWPILILCKQGFGVEASLILRAQLNNLIALNYIAKDDKRAIRYAEFESVFRKHGLDLLQTSKTLEKEKKEELRKLDEELSESIDQIRSKYGLKNPRPMDWPGCRIKKMAEDVGMDNDYNLVYGQLSELEHSGPGSVQRYAKIEGSDVVLEPGPSEEMIEIVLFTSFRYMFKMLEKTNEIVGLNANNLLEDADKRFREVYNSFILAHS